MKVAITLTGMREANRSFGRLPSLMRAELGREMKTATQTIAGRIADRAPRRTGRLAAAVSARARNDERGASVVIDESLAPYWKHVEHGTSRMSARPFVRTGIMAAEGSHQGQVDQAAARADRQLT